MKIEVVLADRGAITFKTDWQLTQSEALSVARRATKILTSFDKAEDESLALGSGSFGFGPTDIA